MNSNRITQYIQETLSKVLRLPSPPLMVVIPEPPIVEIISADGVPEESSGYTKYYLHERTMYIKYSLPKWALGYVDTDISSVVRAEANTMFSDALCKAQKQGHVGDFYILTDVTFKTFERVITTEDGIDVDESFYTASASLRWYDTRSTVTF